MGTRCNTEYFIDIIAYIWDIIKYIIVYCGIYLNLFKCVNMKNTMIIRRQTITIKSIKMYGRTEEQKMQFMKLLIYYWSSKYLDKDFDTFIRIFDRHIKNIPNSKFTAIINISQQKYDMRINVNLTDRTVNVSHIKFNDVDPSNIEICTHVIEDSYGFDLIDILDFAVGRSICPLIHK